LAQPPQTLLQAHTSPLLYLTLSTIMLHISPIARPDRFLNEAMPFVNASELSPTRFLYLVCRQTYMTQGSRLEAHAANVVPSPPSTVFSLSVCLYYFFVVLFFCCCIDRPQGQ
jgi:hypothetical protein